MTDSPELPDGWASPSIGETCLVNPRKIESEALPPDASVTFVPMPSVDAEAGAITSPETRSFNEVRKGYTSFIEGDVIVAKITPCMENGKAAVARGLENGVGFGSTEFHVIRSDGAAIPEYVYHFVRQESFRRAAVPEMTGSVGQKRVPEAFLSGSSLPLPPLAEQRRIVAKVDELLGRVNAVRERLAGVPAILKRFRQSVLAAACSGRLTEDSRNRPRPGTPNPVRYRSAEPAFSPMPPSPGEGFARAGVTILRANTGVPTKPGASDDIDTENLLARVELLRRKHFASTGSARYPEPVHPSLDLQNSTPSQWPLVSLDALTTLVTSGSRGWAAHYSDTGPLFVRAQNVNSDRLVLDDIAHVQPPDSAEGRRTQVRFGDLLVTITGANVTKTGVVDKPIGEAYVSQHVALVRPVDPEMSPYLHLWVISPKHGRQKLNDDAYGAGKPGLNLDNIREMAVAVPPLAEQREIVRRVEALFKQADVVEAKVAAGIARVEKLTQAILAKAFRGELVPTEAELARREGRDYEPASVLLERIRAARTQETSGKRTARSPRRK